MLKKEKSWFVTSSFFSFSLLSSRLFLSLSSNDDPIQSFSEKNLAKPFLPLSWERNKNSRNESYTDLHWKRERALTGREKKEAEEKEKSSRWEEGVGIHIILAMYACWWKRRTARRSSNNILLQAPFNPLTLPPFRFLDPFLSSFSFFLQNLEKILVSSSPRVPRISR